jgi:two-component system sensor histidine kinase BaeS
MLKTLRQLLILSHILPLLVIIPIVGIALIYVLETRVLLPNLARELTGQAELVGELAGDRPDIWHNQSEAEAFTREMSGHISARVMLLNSEGRLLASSEPTDHERLNETVNLPPLADTLAGRTSTQTTYSRRLQTEIADVWLPILGADRQVTGVVRLSQRLFAIEEQFARLRYFIAGVLISGLVLGSMVGLVLAISLEHPLQRMTQAVYLLTSGQRQKPLPEQGPQEIRGLIHAVNTLVQQLRNSEEHRRQLLANLIHEIVGEIDQLRRLLDDLAHLQDQVSGTLTLQTQPVPLSQWLHRMLVSWREAAQEKGLNWEVAVPSNLPVLKLDPDRLGQALGNLLSNAVKYTPAEGAVSISAGVENESVWFRVSDTGPGIAPEDQRHIFTPFRRINQNGGYEAGMGLGLSIAQDLIVAHAGRLEVESSPGLGSHFTVWLPLRQDRLFDNGRR